MQSMRTEDSKRNCYTKNTYLIIEISRQLLQEHTGHVDKLTASLLGLLTGALIGTEQVRREGAAAFE